MRGLTIIELMVAVAVLAVLTSLGAPAFERARDRYRLRGAADALIADLQLARLEGIRTNQGALVQISGGSTWCWGVNLGSTACDCATAGSCSVKSMDAAAYPGLSLASSFGATPRFEARSGLSNGSGTVTLSSTHGYQVLVSVSALGLVSVCTPSGSAHAGAYPTC